MVAIEFTEDGKVRAGPIVEALATPPVHPAAEMFPSIGDANVERLKKDILRNGLKVAIVMTPNGELLEGRGRWKACRKLELVPKTRVHTGDPWLYILEVHRVYLDGLLPQHKAMIAGKVPRWGKNARPRTNRRYEDPPTLEAIAVAAGIESRQSISRAQQIYLNGTESLVQITAEERVPLNTAVRISNLDSDKQEVIVQRILNGEHPFKVMPSSREALIDRRRKDGIVISAKHQYVRSQTIRGLIDALGAVHLVVDAAEGLDPSITPEEAAQFAIELRRQHVAYRHVADLLKQRKDEQ